MTFSLKPLKWYKSLATKKGRAETGAFLIEGARGVQQIVNDHPESILEIVSINTLPTEYGRFNTRLIDEKQFKSISSAGTPQGILAVVIIPDYTYSDTLPVITGNRVLLLEDVQDPGNVGTLVRTAAAFGYDGIVMSENCADPFASKCIQATAGSILSVWIRRSRGYRTMIDSLKSEGFTLAAAVLDGTKGPETLKEEEKLLLALGNEAAGLSEETVAKADRRIRIPIDTGKAESLNVASSGAILMYISRR